MQLTIIVSRQPCFTACYLYALFSRTQLFEDFLAGTLFNGTHTALISALLAPHRLTWYSLLRLRALLVVTLVALFPAASSNVYSISAGRPQPQHPTGRREPVPLRTPAPPLPLANDDGQGGIGQHAAPSAPDSATLIAALKAEPCWAGGSGLEQDVFGLGSSAAGSPTQVRVRV